MAKSPGSLRNCVTVAARYVRSINIERDLPDPGALKGYKLTDRTELVLNRMLSGLQNGSTQRAWRLTGPYGAGKSALGLLLASLFKNGFSRRSPAGKLLYEYAASTHALGARAPQYRPIVLQGEYADVSISLAERLHSILSNTRASRARTTLAKSLNRFMAGRRRDNVPPDAVLALLERFATLEARSASPYQGTLLIVDELGRFLDFAAGRKSNIDAGFLQALAEKCAGQADVPIAVIGILHQRFEDYARSMGGNSRLLEWSKVAERFEEVTLEESLDGACMLLADAIDVDSNQLSNRTVSASQKRNQSAVESGLLPAAIFEKNSTALYPLHPIAAVALTVLSRRLGQNERSVYSFLLSQDSGGFQAFVGSSSTGPKSVFRLSDLCDYLLGQGGLHLADKERNRRWSLLQECMRSAPFHDGTELDVLKTVGVLNLLEPIPNMAATAVSVALAVSDSPKSKAVLAAIDRLVGKNVLFRRPATDELCIWPRSSVDISREFRRLESRIGSVRRLDEVLSRMPAPRPIVAHRHYIQTGTLRSLQIKIFADANASAIENGVAGGDLVDGCMGVVPVYPDQDEAAVLKALIDCSSRLPESVVLVPQPVDDRALTLARELQVWRAVEKDCAALRIDEYARAEVENAITRTASALSASVAGFRELGLQSSALTVVNRGQVTSVGDGVNLSRWASDFFDMRFPKAPILHNELINRVNVSTQAASARTRLIEAMLANEDRQHLAISKTPPEKAIYLTLLHESGMHRCYRNGDRRFGAPTHSDPRRWAAAWRAVEQRLSGPQPVRVSELLQILGEPPYGVRESPALVLVVVVMLANRFKLTLREERTFVTELTVMHLGRMAKAPHRFDCRIVSAGRKMAAVIDVYHKVYLPDEPNADVGDVVRALYRWYLGLSTYVMRTKQLSVSGRALLQVLEKANEPIALLCEEIPGVFDFRFSTQSDPKAVVGLHQALSACVTEVANAPQALFDRICSTANNIFELPEATTLGQLRQHILDLCLAVGNLPHEEQISAIRLRTVDSNRSDEKWLESIGSLLTDKTIETWEDDTLRVFEATLNRVANVMRHISALRRVSKEQDVDATHLIGIHIVDAFGRERAFTVNTRTQTNAQDDVYQSLRDTLANVPDAKRMLALLLSEFAAADRKLHI